MPTAVSSATSAPTLTVATDFSPHAWHAAQRAARIAQQSSAPLRLLHVLPGAALAQLRGWLGIDTAVEQQLKADAWQALHEQADRLRASGVAAVVPVLTEGPVLDAVLADAQAQDAQLLVVGMRGAGFMRRALLGTTCERLMRRTARPVLAVRQAPHEAYRRVMVAVDLSAASLASIHQARRLAPQAQLMLATVYELPYENRLRMAGVSDSSIAGYRERCRADASQRLQLLAARAGLPSGDWQPCIVEGDPSFKLVELEQMLDCDLTVVGKHSASALTDVLLGSVTQHVLSEGQADVLIVSAHD